jgi:hypothetical protein
MLRRKKSTSGPMIGLGNALVRKQNARCFGVAAAKCSKRIIKSDMDVSFFDFAAIAPNPFRIAS